MANIAIDITTTQDQFSNRGVGKYTKNIVEQLITLSSKEDIHWHLIGFTGLEKSIREWFEEYDKYQKNITLHELGNLKLSSPANNYFFWHQKLLPFVEQLKPDLYFSPEFQRGIPVGVTKTVVMIHDIIPITHNEYSPKGSIFNFAKGIYYKTWFKHSLLADMIITNSLYSATQIHNRFRIPMTKLNPVLLGLEQDLKLSTEQQRIILAKYQLLDLEGDVEKYLLYCSGFEVNKNVPFTIRLFKALLAKRPDVKLVIAGKAFKLEGTDVRPLTPEAREIMATVNQLNVSQNIVFTGYVSDSEMVALRQNATALINLSKDEGFGFPVLEGMKSGVPVIASDIPIYREITKGGAMLINLEQSVTESAQKIALLLQSQPKMKQMVEYGKEIAAQYQWENTGKATLELILELLNNAG